MNVSDNYNDMATAMQYFFDKQVTISKNTNAYDENTGMYSRAESETITINCNVQPLDTKTDLDESGKLIDAQYKIYCDSNSFITSDCMVTYNGKDYVIQKITDWDYYYIVYIRAVV